MKFQPDSAMGVYALTAINRAKLKSCTFKEVVECEQFNGFVFVFNDPYRKLNIDILFTGYGELLISDFYGESMKREDIFYIKLGA